MLLNIVDDGKGKIRTAFDKTQVKGKWKRKLSIRQRVISRGPRQKPAGGNGDPAAPKPERRPYFLKGSNTVPLGLRKAKISNNRETAQGKVATEGDRKASRPSGKVGHRGKARVSGEDEFKGRTSKLFDCALSDGEEGVADEEGDSDLKESSDANAVGSEQADAESEEGSSGKDLIPQNLSNADSAFAALGLDGQLCDRLARKMEITKPTAIQEKMIPSMLKDTQKDICMQSMTGSGKSLSFLLPIIQRLLSHPYLQRSSADSVRQLGTVAILLSPTRELATQLYTVLETLLSHPFMSNSGSRHVNLVPGIIIGGDKRKSEKARLRKGIHILVATPGRLLDHLESTKSFQCSALQCMVLDEADRLLDLGFEKKVKKIVDIIREKMKLGVTAKGSSPSVQLVMCSATLQERVLKLADETLRSPMYIRADSENEEGQGASEIMEEPNRDGKFAMPKGLTQSVLITPPKVRHVTLLAHLRSLFEKHVVLLGESFKVIIFMSCCDSVDFHHALWSMLRADETEGAAAQEDEDGEVSEGEDKPMEAKDFASRATCPYVHGAPLYKLHGSMDALDRKRIFASFCKAKFGIMLCTDVAARGLDLPHVNLIIQYDAPSDLKDYVHRVGRTARNGRTGRSLLFLMSTEEEYIGLLEKRGICLDKDLNLKSVLKDAFGTAGKKTDLSVIQGKAIELQSRIERLVETKAKQMACMAFIASLRAYSTHPSEEKSIFHIKRLHSGHLAKAFGLKDAPRKLSAKSLQDLRKTAKKRSAAVDLEEGEQRKAKRQRPLVNRVNPASEFDSGI